MSKQTCINHALVMAASVFLVGCASTLNTASNDDFACGPDRTCPTPFEVYNQTNHVPSTVKNGRNPESWKSGSNSGGSNKGGSEASELRMDLAVAMPSAHLAVATDPPALPLREPSQVMRIWIAPWIDQGDNLNWSGYIYTEITPKRWSFGEQEVRHQGLPPQIFSR